MSNTEIETKIKTTNLIIKFIEKKSHLKPTSVDFFLKKIALQ